MSDLVIALVAFAVLFVVFIILSCIMGGEKDVHSPPPLPRPGQLRMPVYRTKDKDLGGDGTAISVAGTDIYGGSGVGSGGHGGRGIITSDTKLPSPPPPSPLPPRPVQRPKSVSRTKDRELIDTGTAMLVASSLLTSGSASSCSGGGSHGHGCGGGGGGGGGGFGGGGCGGGGCGG
ncbi:hypothetical protein ISN44_As03g014830 [Arabidopsis suecica]|uniref:Uncharacterized protein n=1 Tax=Arabidopsis suecica TaxID=45249 RepID=A0A8T2F4H8_ARASU|nr:hypothetical protein ISN44_As03g014830 [Arabidopsis suecica]